MLGGDLKATKTKKADKQKMLNASFRRFPTCRLTGYIYLLIYRSVNGEKFKCTYAGQLVLLKSFDGTTVKFNLVNFPMIIMLYNGALCCLRFESLKGQVLF